MVRGRMMFSCHVLWKEGSDNKVLVKKRMYVCEKEASRTETCSLFFLSVSLNSVLIT